MELITKALQMTNTAAAQASAMMNNPLAVSAHLFRPIPFASRTAVRMLTPHLLRTGRYWEETGRLWAHQSFSTAPASTFSWKQLGWGKAVLLDLRRKETLNAIVINSGALIPSPATQLSYCGTCASHIWDQSVLLLVLPAPC